MSTTTQDVLLSDERIAYMRMGAGLSVHGSVDANPDAVQIAMEAAEGGCRFAMAEMEAERTKLLELLQQGVDDAQDFVDKCDRGQASSTRTYARHKAFLAACKDVGIEPSQD